MINKDRLTDHIQIVSLGESSDGEQFCRLIVTLAGRRRSELISLREFEGSHGKAMAALNAHLISTSAQTQFRERIQRECLNMRPTFRVVTKPGWSGDSFIFPNSKWTPAKADLNVCLPLGYSEYGAAFVSRGPIERWRRIARLARGNPPLMLALALSFAGPVIDLLGLDTVMIQLVGLPGFGKTAIAHAVGATWGRRPGGLPFMLQWNQTTNNVEKIAAAHHATFLILNETRTFDRTHSRWFDAFCSVIMRLSEGDVRGHMPDQGAPVSFKLAILSTSNESLDDMADLVGATIDDALRDRLIDVPLVGSVGGAFSDLHRYDDHHALASDLIDIARRHHGVASEEFIERFTGSVARDKKGTCDWLFRRREEYLAVAQERVVSPKWDLSRRHQKFATIYAAGCLAIAYDVLPWTRRELIDALIACEQAHVGLVEGAARTSVVKARARDPLELLKAHVRERRDFFVDLREGLVDPDGDHDHDACDGYINEHDGQLEVLFSDAKLIEICGSLAAVRQLKGQLNSAGMLRKDEHRPSVKRTIWRNKRREQVIAISAEFFGLELFQDA